MMLGKKLLYSVLYLVVKFVLYQELLTPFIGKNTGMNLPLPETLY